MARDAYVSISGLTKLRLLLDKVIGGGIGSKKLMSEIATFLMTTIKLRTAKGLDVGKDPFDPYSSNYAMFRKKKGHPVDKVSLFLTGSMMSAMTYKATATTAKIYFMNTSDLGGTKNPSKAYWLNKKREFFALSGAEMRQVESMVKSFIAKELI